MHDLLERIRSISLSADDLHREMLYVAEAINQLAREHAGQCRFSLREENPLRLRAVFAHADAGRLACSLDEGGEILVVCCGPALAHWWAEQLASPVADPVHPFHGISLHEGELAILRALRRSGRRASFRQELAAQTGIMRRTLGEYLSHLRSLHFIESPRGERGGDSLTEVGRQYLDAHDTQ